MNYHLLERMRVKGFMWVHYAGHDMTWKSWKSLGGGFKYFYFHPYLGKIPNLTNIFKMGWNHQLDHFKSTFQSGLRFRSHGFSWNHPSNHAFKWPYTAENTAGCLELFADVFCNKKKKVSKPFPFKTNRTKTWLTFLVRSLLEIISFH